MQMNIEELGLPDHLAESLKAGGIRNREQLAQAVADGTVSDIKGVGKKTEQVIRRALGVTQAATIDKGFFFVGVAMFVVATAMTAWAFTKGTLTPDQRSLMRWLLAPASCIWILLRGIRWLIYSKESRRRPWGRGRCIWRIRRLAHHNLYIVQANEATRA